MLKVCYRIGFKTYTIQESEVSSFEDNRDVNDLGRKAVLKKFMKLDMLPIRD